MSFLIDTNVISEVRKEARCDPAVTLWYSSIKDSNLYLSGLILGEICKGIELARPRHLAKAEALQAWLGAVVEVF